VDTSRLSALCELVANRARRSIHRAKPITGADVFRHESGIHTAALLKNPVAYQPFPAKEVGRTPEGFVTGKHSGSAGVRASLQAGGISVPALLARKSFRRCAACPGRKKAASARANWPQSRDNCRRTGDCINMPISARNNLQDVSPRFFWAR